MGFFSESEKSFEKMIPSKRTSYGEQNDAISSFVAPSSEELRVFKVLVKLIHYSDDLYQVCTFEWEASIGTLNSSLEGAMKLKFAPFCSS